MSVWHPLVYSVFSSRSLFYDEKIIVFLSFLDKYIFAVEKHGLGSGKIYVGHFILVDRQSVALGKLAQFTFAGEHFRLVGEKRRNIDRAVKVATLYLKFIHALEYIEKCLLVDIVKQLMRPCC